LSVSIGTATLILVRFVTGMPGLSRYPPVEPPWAPKMSTADIQRLARGIDDLGFDGLLVPEHIVLPPDLAEAMGAHWPHALTAMSFLAGATTRLTVISAIVILPLHTPVVLAKEIATLDVLSGGRLIVAFGVGHAAEEFEALGVRFDQRGRMADEYLEAMSVLWSEDVPSFTGDYVRFADIRFEPKPIQKPHPPIWIGGNSRASLRRAARWQGWFPWQVTAAELPLRLAELRRDRTFADGGDPFDVMLPVSPVRVDERDHRPLDAGGGAPIPPASAQAAVDAVGALAEIGVTWTSVPPPGPPSRTLDEYLERLDWVAREVMCHFR
jgi:probable F420-dependent oxidoreductase